jgi:hypothetical protein
MDSDEQEMVAALLEEEAKGAIVAAADEHMHILSCLLAMYTLDMRLEARSLEAGAAQEQAEAKPGGLLHIVRPLLRRCELTFRRRFRMNRIVLAVREYNTYFVCKQDYVGTLDFSSIQNCTTASGCLPMELLAIHMMTTCAWPCQLPLTVCIGSAGQWSQCFENWT